MAKRKKKQEQAFEIGSLEQYDVVKIHRSQLKNATYNPRKISDDERLRLRAIIAKHGLVSPPTWNKRTQSIVGGHQRISLLDDLYQTSDYELRVAAIDVDDVREREINLALNNTAAMGDTDLEKLEALLRDTPSIDVKAAGFDPHELFRIFGDSPFEKRGDDMLSEVAQKIREARQRQEQTKTKVKSREEMDFFLVVVFRNDVDRDRFCADVGWEIDRYQSGDQLRVIAGDWIADRKAESDRGAGADQLTDAAVAGVAPQDNTADRVE